MVNGSGELVKLLARGLFTLIRLAHVANQLGDFFCSQFVFERRHRFVAVRDVVDHLGVGVLDCMIGFQRRHLDGFIVHFDYAAVCGWPMTRFTVFRVISARVCKLDH